MAGVRFAELQSRPMAFLDFTSVTLDEFQPLVPPFEAAFHARMAAWRMDGKPRTARRFTVYKNCPLPTPDDRLLFILGSLKTYALQVVQGRGFGMVQGQANQWIDVLLLALLVALRAVGDAPARSRSCPCRLRINLSGSPVYRDRSKKAWTRELAWLPSGPLSPGDALDAGRPDTCHLLRSPLFAVSSHRSLLTDPLAGATAARKRAALRAGSTHGRSAQRPSLACAAATAWPSRCHGWVRTVATAGVRRRVANRNDSTHDTMRAAGVGFPGASANISHMFHIFAFSPGKPARLRHVSDPTT